MRREGYIIEEIIEYSNMSEAFDTVLRGTDRKRSTQGRYLLAHREQVIAKLTEAIASGSFQLGGYHEREIEEYGKKRTLQILSMYDRIAVYAVMNVLDRHLQKRYIRTTGASIKRRGTHDLMNCIRTDLQKDPEYTLYAYKFDIRRFYDNVRQDFVMWCFRRVFKDERLLVLLERFVTMLPEGISFGLRSSQGAGNLLLSVFLDHYLKDRYGVRYYYRYCDDGLVLGKTKAELWKCRGVFFGLSAIHTRKHLLRAVMEGVAYSLCDCNEILQEMGVKVDCMKACGGGGKSPVWRQMLADLYNCSVERVVQDEGPALGVAILAGVACGLYESVEKACDQLITRRDSTEPKAEDVAVYEKYHRQ